MMPKSVVRLSAGRTEMGEAMQALCFFAGANSIFYGEQLLTTDNPDTNTDTDTTNVRKSQKTGKARCCKTNQ
jgi:biotin synthase